MKERVQYSSNILTIMIASLKTLLVKPSRTKPGQNKKECIISIVVFSPSCRYDYHFFNTSIGKSLNLCILMLYLNFFNVVEDNVFAHGSVRLSHGRPNLLNINFTFLLKLMSIEEFGRDMLSFVTFYGSFFNLCNIRNIIFM